MANAVLTLATDERVSARSTLQKLLVRPEIGALVGVKRRAELSK
jgi:simple sugar transport system permease protein